jgi:hypothetical protein
MPPKKRQTRKQALAGRLAAEGYSFPFPVDDILDKAIRSGSDDVFSLAYSMILSSKRFRREYPGIFRGDGTLRMTPAQYTAYRDTVRHTAENGTFTISNKAIGRLIANDVSAEEFSFRVDAAKQIKANPDVFDSFNDLLEANGQKRLKTSEQIFDFLTGRSNSRVYDIYERSSIRGAAEAAGLSLTRAQARRLGESTADVTGFETALERFARVADDLTTSRQELRSFGIGEDDLIAMEFGGQQARVRLREQALRQRQAEVSTRLVTQRAGVNRQGRVVTAAEAPEAGF